MSEPQAQPRIQPPQHPQDAVICFIIHGGQVLLIKKLRGLGTGKINGPGGKVEKHETFLQAAIRETQEEVALTPLSPEHRANLDFTFTDGYRLKVQVFVSTAFTGTPAPSPEAEPFWCPLENIPYSRMWEDDRLWLPRVLAGEFMEGTFLFDGDTMLEAQVSSISR